MVMESLRSPEELQSFVREHGFTATLHPADEPMPTVEAAAVALGIAPEEMTKNVVFIVEGRPVLAIAAGETRVDDRALARHFGVGRKKVKLASAQQTFEATGFVAGCVPPFGHRELLPTLVDESVLQLERVYGGTGDPKVLISLPPDALLSLTNGVVLPLGQR
jgi:prolyl-tRNA editing enzyme YbaK/EbsC (Cys-tRNA(Pro) deacylase)